MLQKREVREGLCRVSGAWAQVFMMYLSRWGSLTLKEEMATRFSILARKVPWTEEPGGLQSTGSQRVRQDWSDLSHSYIFITVVLFLSLPNPMLYVTSFCKTCILNHIEKWKSNTVLAFFFFHYDVNISMMRSNLILGVDFTMSLE